MTATPNVSKMQRRIRTSSTLVFLGLIVELLSLLWSHPTAFVVFLVLGASLMGVGILIYFYSLVSIPESSTPSEGPGDSPSNQR
jgi:hypothetical protein